MDIIVNLGKANQRTLSWEEAVSEFNLSRIAMYGQKTTLSCRTTLTFINIKVVNTIAIDVEYSLFQKDIISKSKENINNMQIDYMKETDNSYIITFTGAHNGSNQRN